VSFEDFCLSVKYSGRVKPFLSVFLLFRGQLSSQLTYRIQRSHLLYNPSTERGRHRRQKWRYVFICPRRACARPRHRCPYLRDLGTWQAEVPVVPCMALRASHGGELPSRPVPRVQGVYREKYTHLAANNSVPAWIFISCMHWLPLTTEMLTTPLLPPRTIAPPVIALVCCRACSVLLLCYHRRFLILPP
jgi:hypothetical protein